MVEFVYMMGLGKMGCVLREFTHYVGKAAGDVVEHMDPYAEVA
jgi:hypothetical protein